MPEERFPYRPGLEVRCDKRQGNCSYFTDGKVYHAEYVARVGRTMEIQDDYGNPRCIIPDGTPCGHMMVFKGKYPSKIVAQEECGRFVLVGED